MAKSKQVVNVSSVESTQEVLCSGSAFFLTLRAPERVSGTPSVCSRHAADLREAFFWWRRKTDSKPQMRVMLSAAKSRAVRQRGNFRSDGSKRLLREGNFWLKLAAGRVGRAAQPPRPECPRGRERTRVLSIVSSSGEGVVSKTVKALHRIGP